MRDITRAWRRAALSMVLAACSAPAGIDRAPTGEALRDAHVPTASQTAATGIQTVTVVAQDALGPTPQIAGSFGVNARKIYGNLGEDGAAYDCCVAFSVDALQEVAMGFVPDANYTVTGFALALSRIGGPNVYNVSLRADNSGVPGAVLRTWTISSPAPFGSCCALAVVRNWSALPILQGALYWLVASPEGRLSNGGWNWNNRGAIGTVGYTNGGVWNSQTGLQSAFAIYGKLN